LRIGFYKDATPSESMAKPERSLQRFPKLPGVTWGNTGVIVTILPAWSDRRISVPPETDRRYKRIHCGDRSIPSACTAPECSSHTQRRNRSA